MRKRCHSFCVPKLGSSSSSENGIGRGVTVRASGGENDSNFVPLAPVELESPMGQLLEQILRTHPHLLPVTVDEQLEKIATEKENLKAELSSTHVILSKRISEVRDKERRKTLAEIIYCLVVHRFVEKGISMIPQIKPTSRKPLRRSWVEAVFSIIKVRLIPLHIAVSQYLFRCFKTFCFFCELIN